MTELIPKNVVITQNSLKNFAGSEIITLELAETFVSMGSNVLIYTNLYDYPIKKEFKKINNIKILTNEKDLKKYLPDIDLLWVHHQLLPEVLLKSLQDSDRTRIIFHHMSSFHPLEYPFSTRIEQQLADYVLYNSSLTREAFASKGFKSNHSLHDIFNNPAPKRFYDAGKQKKRNSQIKKIVIISNHIPSEIVQILDVLKQKEIGVNIIGSNNYGIPKKVTPQLINSADVVITIGKTVQYAVMVGTPVYCYDYFGGPGYLNEENYQQAEFYGYSGKGFCKKNPKVIIEELFSQYNAAMQFASRLRIKLKDKYILEDRILGLLNDLKNRPRTPKRLLRADSNAHLRVKENIRNYYLESERFREENHLMQKHIENLQERLRLIELSKSWRYTKLFRKVKRKIDGIKKS